MTPNSASSKSYLTRLILRMLRLCAVIALLTIICAVQSKAQSNPTQGFTPSGLKPGAPAGSYGLSGFDNINLYNGNLNFGLPLIGIGGRGGAKTQMMLAIDSVRWSIDKDTVENVDVYYINPNWWGGLRVGYGPGVLQGRVAIQQMVQAPFSRMTTTRLTFTAADGTEYELRDKVRNGQVIGGAVGTLQRPRGRIFVSVDGTAVTFVSDAIIYDPYTAAPEYMYPTGYLFMADGTRYRIEAGLVKKIRDRNGNEMSFAYDSNNRVTSITDSLNRQVTVGYGFLSQWKPKYTYDLISYKGFGGTQRSIKIWRTNLGRILRADFSGVMSYNDLFPGLGGSASTYYDPLGIASSVELPDGRTYELRYNQWGNLARVVLPTGGAIEYDYANNFTTEYIHRPVTERRVYIDGATNTLEGKQTYSQTFTTSPSRTETIVKQYDSGTALLAHSKHYFEGAPGPSQGYGMTSFAKWDEGREYKTETLSLNETGLPILRRIEQTWQQSPDTGLPVWWSGGLNSGPIMNPRLVETVSTLMDSIPNKKSKQTAINPVTLAVAFDQYNNQTDSWETDYGDDQPGIWLRHTHTDYMTTNPVNGKSYDTLADDGDPSNPNIANTVHIRRLAKEQLVYSVNPTTGADVSVAADTKFTFDQFELTPRSYISGLDSAYTTAYSWRGNLTRTSRWLDLPTSTWLNSDLEYDVAGNVTRSIDARGNATTLNYGDNFGSPNGEAQTNTAPTELGTLQSYAFLTSVSNALNHTSFAQFDYYLGVPVDGQDVNGVVATGYYTNSQGQTDPLDRPLRVVQAVGTSAQNQGTFTYDDANRTIIIKNDLHAFNDSLNKSVMVYDGFGRTTEERKYEDVYSFIATRKSFDALGRVYRVSNPFRSGETVVWTITRYDALNRVYEIETPDGAHVNTAYNNNLVTIVDQQGKQRRSQSDALGRLKQVVEDPIGLNYATTYTYDVLDNLRKVEQDTQRRYFLYDSLSNLIRVKNPEQSDNSQLLPSMIDPVTGQSSWSVFYTYDANGNPDARVDARNMITTFGYDALNRNTTITYSANANTPNIINRYDAAISYGKGRLWQSETTGDKGTMVAAGSFDAQGRPLSLSQQFKTGRAWSQAYTVQRTYNASGGVSSQTYPSGHSINYSYDDVGRTQSFSGNLGDGVQRTYAEQISYDVRGRVEQEKYGTQITLYNKRRYNVRGQLYDLRLSTQPRSVSATDWDRGCLAFYYSVNNQALGGSGTDNSGNLMKSEVYVPNADGSYNVLQDRYEYDSLNRLQHVNEYQYGTQQVFVQAYIYDRWGNRSINQSSSSVVNKLPFTVDASTNRLGVPVNLPGELLYDDAGNLTKDTYSSSDVRTYDAENRLEINTNGANQVSRFTYDSSGARVRRLVNGTEVWQVYGMDDELLAEYVAGSAPSSAQKEHGYRNRELLVTATNTGNVEWLICDQLGTPRLVADKIGGLSGVKRHDYLPFGEEIGQNIGGRTSLQGYVADGVRQQFTGKERDYETGLDYFGARYYSSMQGRFTSPDKPLADQDPIYPQSWNLYNYVRNNPLKYVDEFGEEIFYASPELEEISNNLRAESTTYDEALKGFEGEGAPDLTIQMGDAEKDADGKSDATGLTKTFIAEEGTDGTGYTDENPVMKKTPAKLDKAIIIIDTSLEGDLDEIKDTVAHEVGHADHARKEPHEYNENSKETKRTNGATEHDKRPNEKRANQFRDQVKKEREATRKRREEEERQRKKQEQERKKLEEQERKKAKPKS